MRLRCSTRSCWSSAIRRLHRPPATRMDIGITVITIGAETVTVELRLL
jgi:hypothetical protein